MFEGRRWVPIRVAGLVGVLATAAACGSMDADSAGGVSWSPDYQLGGQTGSLVPTCGVAPLSAAGAGVPAGDAVAVLYTQDCPEQALAEQLALAGQAVDAVLLELVPLEGTAVFLVRADQSLPGGEYQLTLASGASSDVRIGEEALSVPSNLGPLRLLSSDATCVERLQFELTLDAAELAYAPLSRFEVSIDGGAEQVWVDYGALPIERTVEGSRGLLELPRCGSTGCLEGGSHRLQLRSSVAGESLQPEPLELTFDVNCPVSTDDADASASGCSISRSAAPATPGSLWAVSSCLLWSVLRRHTRRRT